MIMENLDYTFFDKCSSLSDAARKIFNKDDYRSCEKIKTIALEYGFDWKIWNERRKTKIVETVCLCCGSIIKQPNNKRLKKFCNSSCAAKYNNSKRRKNSIEYTGKCKYCGKDISYPKKYCNIDCQNLFEQKEYIENWQKGLISGVIGKYGISHRIRKYLLIKNNYKCEKCGWGEINPITNKVPLQIHHIDGDCLNNREENLQLLCPNCHSLTETFGNLNKNSKRIFRKQKLY